MEYWKAKRRPLATRDFILQNVVVESGSWDKSGPDEGEKRGKGGGRG